jgi:hypothetical protein
LSSLSDVEKAKIRQCTSTNEIWVKLQNSYSEETSMKEKYIIQVHRVDQENGSSNEGNDCNIDVEESLENEYEEIVGVEVEVD